MSEEIKNEMEKAFDKIFVRKCENPEIQQLLDGIVDEEKKHVLHCYELAVVKETYCENCIPYCLVKTEDGKTFKRTTPRRY